jgi:hypothetical protein
MALLFISVLYIIGRSRLGIQKFRFGKKFDQTPYARQLSNAESFQ